MTLPELLRAAGAWLKLAADEIDAGHEDKARDYVRMGRFGIESEAVTAFVAGDVAVPKESP